MLVHELMYIHFWTIGEVRRLDNQRLVYRFLSADYDSISEYSTMSIMSL